MEVSKIIVLARKHLAANPANELSARICLADAVALSDKGDFESSKVRALKSLAYSVGILSPVYARASGADKSSSLSALFNGRVPKRVYTGRAECCRCGCKGTYHEKGSVGYSRAMTKLVRGVAGGLIGDDLGNCIDFEFGNDRAICVYFD